MSSESANFTTKLLDSILKYTAKLEVALKNGNYIKALKIFDELIQALNDIRPVLVTAAEAQKNGDEFDIVCNTKSCDNDIDSNLFTDDGDAESNVPRLGEFPSLYPKNNHGPD